ncbi:hypothetical protein H5410_011656, partial [Solanum commersonii]
DRYIAIDRPLVGQKLNHLLLFYLHPTDELFVAIDGSSVERKLDHLLLFSFLPIDELAGATIIKREALVVPGNANDVAINIDVNVGVDIGDVGAKSGGENVDDIGECKNKETQLIAIGEDVKKSLDVLTSVVKKLISKRGKPSVATDKSCGAVDDSSIAINDLYVGTSFWFNLNLTWYCNMIPTGNLSVAIDNLPVGYAIVNF